MNALLVRVGADLSSAGGSWNGPINTASREFVYVPIPEANAVHSGLDKPYKDLEPILTSFGVRLPAQLQNARMHLDPDFEQLTYGDQGERAKQLRENLCAGDLIAFYASFAPLNGSGGLVYALIGVLRVKDFIRAAEVPPSERDINAHSRRVLHANAADLIVRGDPAQSGRFRRCIPIGEYRDRSYRVRRDLLDTWDGISAKNGYLQRSARLPRLLDPAKFLGWLASQHPTLVQANN